jgi:hypothetical protein
LPKCIKIPRDIDVVWHCLKRYIAASKAINEHDASAKSMHEAMRVRVDPGLDFVPSTSC